MDFRPAYRALKDRLESDLADEVRTVTRKNLPASAFPEANQPALVIVETGDDPFPDNERPYGWELHALLVLHMRVSGEDEAPGDKVLELRKRVEDALTWRAGEPPTEDGSDATTLGGVVQWARLGPVSIEDSVRDAAQVSQLMQVSMMVTPPAA